MLNNGQVENAAEQKPRSGLWWLWLAALALVLDQASKHWIIAAVSYGTYIPVLPVFNITHIHNFGAAFSFLNDAGGWQRYFLSGIAIVISALLLWWMKGIEQSNKLLGSAYALILGGALGNLYDRLAYGYVEDFIHVFYGQYNFPAFNIADMAISIGAMLLIYEAFTAKSEKEVEHD